MRRISNGDQSYTLRIPIDVDRTEVCPFRAIDLRKRGDAFEVERLEDHPNGYRCGGTTVLTVRGFESEDAARAGFDRVLHAFAAMHANDRRRAYIRPTLDSVGRAIPAFDDTGNVVRARQFCAILPALYPESDHVVLDGAMSIDFARKTDFRFVERINDAPLRALTYPRDAKLLAACGMSAAASIAGLGVNIVLLTTILEMLSELPEGKREKYQHVATYLERAAKELSADGAASAAVAAQGLVEIIKAIYRVRNSYAHRGVWVAAENGMPPDEVLAIAFELVRAALLLELQALGDGQLVARD